MKNVRSKNAVWRVIRGNLVFILLFLAVFLVFINGLRSAASSERGESLRIAEDSIRRAVVSCYAIEGRYPETFEYIKEVYGVRIDESKYFVMYEIFASNIMPVITVLER